MEYFLKSIIGLHGRWFLSVEILSLCCVRLKRAFRFYTGAINEFLSFLTPLGIIVKAIKFCVGRENAVALFLRHYFFRNFWYFGFEGEPLYFFSLLFNTLSIYFFFNSFPVFNQEIFSFLILFPYQPFRNIINLWLKCKFIQFSSVKVGASLLDISFLFFLFSHSFFV